MVSRDAGLLLFSSRGSSVVIRSFLLGERSSCMPRREVLCAWRAEICPAFMLYSAAGVVEGVGSLGKQTELWRGVEGDGVLRGFGDAMEG
jgi:hypothetical protein